MDRSSPPTFNFVNLSHPDELKEGETQLRIRRLVMIEVGKKHRKPKTRRERNEIVLEFRDPFVGQFDVDRFGGGGIDPFSSYPIEMDEPSRNLVAYSKSASTMALRGERMSLQDSRGLVFRQNSQHSRLLRGSWFPVGLSHASPFHHMLANAQLYMIRGGRGTCPSEHDPVSLHHHTQAVRLVGEEIKDSSKHTSDGLFGSVAGLMCHHVSKVLTFAGGD